MSAELRVVFAGGGTGGHIYPALNLAAAMKEKWPVRFRFFGTERGLEAVKVPEAGYELITIPVAGFQRRLTLKNLSFPFRLWKSMNMSRRYLKEFEPHVVIGTGGYVMGPVLRSAGKLGYTTVLQEQNSYPGVTTRMLAGRADLICVAYDEAMKYTGPEKTVLTGNPVRYHQIREDRETLLKKLRLDPSLRVILIFGGSQGAASINNAVRTLLKTESVPEGCQLLWQTGTREFKEIKDFIEKEQIRHTVVRSFIDPMAEAYYAAEFAVCRAGAMTLSELMIYGVPGILIPLPHAAADHQYKNARAVADKGGAAVVRDDQNLPTELGKKWREFASGEKNLNAMKETLKKLSRKDATGHILELVENILKSRQRWPLN